MPNVAVFNAAGEKIEEIALKDEIFAIEPNHYAVHLAVVSYLANQRQGTQSTLTRAEVSGGGKKPWRQKGTGRARQGSTRSPQWRHGGIALGPKPRDYVVTVNKKVKRLALKSVLSSKCSANEIVVLDSFGLDAIKTKEAAKVLSNLNVGKKTLIVLPEKDDVIYRSTRNICGVKTTTVGTLNVYDLANCDTVLFLKSAIAAVEEVYA